MTELYGSDNLFCDLVGQSCVTFVWFYHKQIVNILLTVKLTTLKHACKYLVNKEQKLLHNILKTGDSYKFLHFKSFPKHVKKIKSFGAFFGKRGFFKIH